MGRVPDIYKSTIDTTKNNNFTVQIVETPVLAADRDDQAVSRASRSCYRGRLVALVGDIANGRSSIMLITPPANIVFKYTFTLLERF